MRILVLMKRFGANKDMVVQDFGRQIRLFENLAEKYDIDFFVPDYRKKERKDVKLHGMNFYIRPYSLFSHFGFMGELNAIIRKNRYNFIVGSTDPLLGILAYRIGKKYNIKSVYDMQDEYSCYLSYKIPLVRQLDKNAVKKSDIVFTVSESLNRLVRTFRKKSVITIQNGIDLKSSEKIKKSSARRKLGLHSGKIIIYVGEISRFKGVDTLISAFKEVQRLVPGSSLLLSGPVIDVDIRGENIIYRKYPEKKEVITALRAADVAVLPNPKSRFSEYCFPYKIAEYMSAGLPIVATDIGDMKILLSGYKDSLCIPGDHFDMASKIIKKLSGENRIKYKELHGLAWKSLSQKIAMCLK